MTNSIYLITNTINSKFYIGKTIHSVEQRWKRHVGVARRGSPHYFHNAIRKYGADAFVVRVLETVDDPGVLNDREIHWIATLEPDYNLTTGGEGVPGFKFSAASRQKMSDAHKGHKHSAEHRQKIRDANTGLKRSDEARQNMSVAQKGIKPSAASRQKMSDAHKGHKHSDATKQKIGVTHTGRTRSDATRQRMRDAWKLRRARAAG